MDLGGGLPTHRGADDRLYIGRRSVAPTAPNTLPSDAAVLNANLLTAAANGSQVLSVSVTDGAGASLGSGQVTVPGGEWFVLGLSPNASTTPPLVPPVIDPPPVVPPTAPPPVAPPPTAATPEPTTLVLAGLGLPLVAVARRLRRKK